MRKIGCLPGTFDPIHEGHTLLADYFVEHTDLDEVWMIVTPMNPLKKNRKLTADFHRIAMVKLAIEGKEKLKVSDIEFGLPKPNYTVQTLDCLQLKFPKDNFVLIIGEDNLLHFEKWHAYEKLLENFQIYVYPRAINVFVPDRLKNHSKVVSVNALRIDVSSTAIRKAIADGSLSSNSLAPKVWNYIQKEKLYQSQSTR